MLFYGTYVRKVVLKAARECGCRNTNVGISCYVIFRDNIESFNRVQMNE